VLDLPAIPRAVVRAHSFRGSGVEDRASVDGMKVAIFWRSNVSLEYPVEGLRCEIEVHLVAASRRVSPQGSQAELSLQDDAAVDG
jgi:hypothetical protein